MTKNLNFALKIKGGGREGGTCEVLRPCHPPKIWNVHKLLYNEGITVGCTNTQAGKGKRLIITDAMTQNGPVDGGLWILKAETKKRKRKTEDLSSKNGKQESIEKDHGSNSENETKEEGLLFEEDYHDSMNAKKFEKYFASLCEKLLKNSVIVPR